MLQAQAEKAKAVYMQRMRELEKYTETFHTPAPMRRDSSQVSAATTSHRRKPPGRVSHAQAAQQMVKANADHKRLMAAASAGPIRKGKAWM